MASEQKHYPLHSWNRFRLIQIHGRTTTHTHHDSKESNRSGESHPSYQHHSLHSSIDRLTPPPPPTLHEPTTPTVAMTKPLFPIHVLTLFPARLHHRLHPVETIAKHNSQYRTNASHHCR
ncbi:hypothetical protein PM082_000694 [Marasmius tenuissimus]|nr:hypothetical protein PM082_000694 [Marasmius tenuissimus]